jgi:hypothetical protein
LIIQLQLKRAFCFATSIAFSIGIIFFSFFDRNLILNFRRSFNLRSFKVQNPHRIMDLSFFLAYFKTGDKAVGIFFRLPNLIEKSCAFSLCFILQILRPYLFADCFRNSCFSIYFLSSIYRWIRILNAGWLWSQLVLGDWIPSRCTKGFWFQLLKDEILQHFCHLFLILKFVWFHLLFSFSFEELN